MLCTIGYSRALLSTRQFIRVSPIRVNPLLKYSTTASQSHSQEGALKGVKILDLSRVLAGPYCTQILADYGADVIKVEQPGKGDDTRSWRTKEEGVAWKSDERISWYFASVNRNKRSMTLNLKHDAGREILLDLVKQADVVVENYIPGKLEELGIGYETLSKVNPAIILASISGYGASGPYKKRAGYDVILAAEAGLLGITGEQDGPPTKPGVGLTDMCTGLYMHGAIVAALQARHRTGVGQRIDTSLFETQLSLLINIGLSWLNQHVEPTKWGTAHPSIVPYEAFTTKDSYLVIGATNDRQFGVLCDRLNEPSLKLDARFQTNDARVLNRDELKRILDNHFASKTNEEWLAIFEGSGLPYGPINNMEKAFGHVQTQARKMIGTVEFNAAKEGKIQLIGAPVKFSSTPTSVRLRPPLLGEHTDEILNQLGHNEESISDLRSKGII
ncbi:dermal papilla derived protein 13 [Xylogone sp. PMI_703]|nr:dermal papilla derived protein 13 [Xylogone sp. PMI_703]